MKNSFTVNWKKSADVTGGSENVFDEMSKHFGFKQISYVTAVKALNCIYPMDSLGFPEVDGSLMIENYVKEMEMYSNVKMFVKNSMQLPNYYTKAHNVCLVQDAHKVAADALYKLGYYDKFSHNRVGKVFHQYQEESCKNTDVILCPSEFMKDAIKSTFSKESHASCPHVVPHGVNLNIFKPMNKELLRDKYNIPKDKKVGIWVGRFHPQKGWHIMADLIWARTDIHWIIVFMDVNNFESNRKNVTIFRKLPRETMPEIYNLADFMVMPSICESFCLASLEATACGLPVIASNTGWHWGYEGPKFGETVTTWNSSEFEAQINNILTKSYEPLDCARNFSIEKWKKEIAPVIG